MSSSIRCATKSRSCMPLCSSSGSGCRITYWRCELLRRFSIRTTRFRAAVRGRRTASCTCASRRRRRQPRRDRTMFLLDTLLLAPGKAVMFLLEELAKKAGEEFLDDDAVKQELQQIYALLEAGQMSETEFASREYRLVEQLQRIAPAKFPNTATRGGAGSPLLPAIDAGVMTLDPTDFQQGAAARVLPDVSAGMSLQPLIDMITSTMSGGPARTALPPAAAPLDVATLEHIRDEENLEAVMRWREQKHADATASLSVAPAVHAVPARIDRMSPVVDAESYAARAVPPSFDRVPPSGPVPPVVTTPPALADRAPIGAEAAPLFVDPAPVISSSPSIDRPPASSP